MHLLTFNSSEETRNNFSKKLFSDLRKLFSDQPTWWHFIPKDNKKKKAANDRMMTEWTHQALKTLKQRYTNWKYIQVTKGQKKKRGRKKESEFLFRKGSFIQHCFFWWLLHLRVVNCSSLLQRTCSSHSKRDYYLPLCYILWHLTNFTKKLQNSNFLFWPNFN